MPPPEPLSGAALAQFRAQTAPALARIRKVENVIYAERRPATRRSRRGRKPASSHRKACMRVHGRMRGLTTGRCSSSA